MDRLSVISVETDLDVLVRLRQAIREAGLRQEDLAKETGESEGYVNAVLCGRNRLKPEYLLKLCRLLKLAPNLLFNYYGD